MFGFIKKEKLLEAESVINNLKAELEQQSELINSEEFEMVRELSKLKLEKELLFKEKLFIENEMKTIVDDANQLSEEIRSSANEEAKETILIANREATQIKEKVELKLTTLKYDIEELKKKKIENESEIKTIIDDATQLSEEIRSSATDEAKEIILIAGQEATNIKKQAELVLPALDKEIEELEKKKILIERKIDKLNGYVKHQDIIQTITDYQYLLDGPISEAIKKKLLNNKQKQKDLFASGKAYKVIEGILWNGNARSGMARQNRLGKFLVGAFNAEVDNIITMTTASNFVSGAKKIEKWFDKVNRGGKDDYVTLSSKILDLRLEEHRHAFEFKMKQSLELEEQRYMRDAIREEEKVKKEIERFVTDREKEEKLYKKDLDKALRKINNVNESEIEKLNHHIRELRKKLEVATSEKERALSMAQLTRSGYVYIISNKGSFGEGVFKIGMTRRLEPMDRVKELGGASVPFYFDVHAMIPSDDAPKLEKDLHRLFANSRVNKVNQRREYFNVSLEEIEEALDSLVDGEFQLVRDVESQQFKESTLLAEQKKLEHV